LKNQSTRKAIEFVEDRLNVVGGELEQSENRELAYLAANEMYNVSSEASTVLGKINTVEAEKTATEYNLMLLDVLEKHVRKTSQSEPFPIPIGLQEGGLAELVGNYNG